MFRASSAHLQEDRVVHIQHMVLSLPMRVPGGLSVHTQSVYRQATRNSHREWQYHMLQVYSCILLKMSTWISKHVEENRILWMNNNQCIKLVINIKSIEEMLHFEVQRQILSKRTNLNILTQTLYGDVLFVTTLFLVLKQKFSSFLKWKWQENCGSRSI